ncbi:class C beta-lactamase-related serine hydrolase [Rhizobium leguminosarum]|uniref:serine hydrolase domain-containing protein n=1 Tax=Rhizobium leguminosarum TaxID=384 RepID=UPI00103224E7|nr:serine hydrolase [Rhizobium leguminosarum]TBD04767.1 class C beta-lactamase-related serine hydrolase [Rhizobium leguminosarum]
MTGNKLSFAENDRIVPGAEWDEVMPEDAGWSTAHLANLAQDLADGRSTSLMIIDAGRIVFQWGDVACKSSVASVRKSLINILYGIYIAEGRINPNDTLADLEIDDVAPLTEVEKTATVMDLLKARSGVYLPSVYDTDKGRPPRGSYKPGTHWFYNNWDFNVLGTILERQTGQTVFEAFASRVAVPLSMQDFMKDDGHFHYGPESRHPVYKIRMSTRDLARVGLLYLRGGRWGETQLVPEKWVQESTQPHSEIGEGKGYGYLWVTAAANAPGDSISTDVPMFYASGFGGQYIIVLPALDLVVVHKSARVDHGVNHARMGEIIRKALAAVRRSEHFGNG